MRCVFHTRRSGPWFQPALRALMIEAGFEPEFRSDATPLSKPGDVIFSDYYRHKDNVRRGVLMPLNENLLAIGLGQTPDQVYHFYIACRDDLLPEMRDANMTPSCEIRPPLALLPKVGENHVFTRSPICIFFPCYGNWTEERCIRMSQAVASSMAAEAGDLSHCTFIVDAPCEPERGRHGQCIVPTSPDGMHYWKILASSIFVCMGSPHIFECSFMDHLCRSGLTKTAVFAENLMTNDVAQCVEEMIQACTAANDYTTFKQWCVECMRVRDSKEMPAFVNRASLVFGPSDISVCCMTLPSLMHAFGSEFPCDLQFIRTRQERAAAALVDKLVLVREYFERYQGTSER